MVDVRPYEGKGILLAQFVTLPRIVQISKGIAVAPESLICH